MTWRDSTIALMGFALFVLPVEGNVGVGLVALFRAGPVNPDHDDQENQGNAYVNTVSRKQFDESVHIGLPCIQRVDSEVGAPTPRHSQRQTFLAHRLHQPSGLIWPATT